MIPILSGIADYLKNKVSFLKFFCYLGSVSCIGLYFFTIENIYLGLFFYFFALFSFWASLVFYNSYLPEIAFPHQGINFKIFSKFYANEYNPLISGRRNKRFIDVARR